MIKNLVGQKIGAQMISTTDNSDFTGAVTVYITGDAGTQAVGTVGSGLCTHEGRGYHTYAPSAAETNYDLIAFTFKGTGAITRTEQVFTDLPGQRARSSVVATGLLQGTLTAREMIRGALTEIGVLGPADTMEAEYANTGLYHLNLMLQSGNIASSQIFTTQFDEYQLTANKQSYTMGVDPAGVLTPDFVAPRPNKIKFANLFLSHVSGATLKRPLHIMTDEEWSDKRYLSVWTYPSEIYSDGGYPFTTLYFFPGPGAAYWFELWTWHKAARITDLDGELLYPDGYDDFWHYNLAKRLCGPYSKALTPDQKECLRDANERITAMNCTVQNPVKKVPRDYRGGRGVFHWRSGDWR